MAELVDAPDAPSPPQTPSIVSDVSPIAQSGPQDSILSVMSSPKQIQTAQTNLAKIQDDKVGAEKFWATKFEQTNAKYASEMEGKLRQEEADTRELRPWDPATMAPPRTSLWEQFGSPGFIVAMLAGSFSAMPMNSALSAGAAAMNAINSGDEEAYNKAYQAWRDNTRLAIDRHALQHAEFENIAKLWDAKDSSARHRMEMALAQFDDKRKAELYRAGLDKEMWDGIAAEQKAIPQIIDASNAIEENNVRRMIVRSKILDEKGQLRPEYAKDPAKIAETVTDAERAQTVPKTAEDMVLNNLIADPTFRQQPVSVQNKMIIDQAVALRSKLAMGAGGTLTDEELAGFGWTKQAIHDAAVTFNRTGRLPTYLGRGQVGPFLMGRIQSEASELLAEEGKSPEDRAVQWQKFSAQRTGIGRFLSGPQGQRIQSLNAVVFHLQTIESLSEALKNGNIVMFNRLAQQWAEETSNPAPTNFDTAKQIVGAEIIKAIGVAGAGTEDERKSAADNFNRARNYEAIHGSVETVKKLLIGQLKSLRQQFTPATGLPVDQFDEMLDPAARNYFSEGFKREEVKGSDSDWGELTVEHGR